MRRITFIAPVESIQGNLSGKQDLRYALNNNKAFESPAGQKNYAKNYQTRYIGARRASDGLKYFAVKTKSATNTSTAAMKAMALLGGSGAIYAALIANKASTLYQHAVAAYENRGPEHVNESMREYLMDIIRRGLANKQQQISLSSQMIINNPWVKTAPNTVTDTVTITNKIISKFMAQLGVNVWYFTIDGEVFAAWIQETWTDFLQDPRESYGKGFSYEDFDDISYMKKGSRFIQNNGAYVRASAAIIDEGVYTTITTAPGA